MSEIFAVGQRVRVQINIHCPEEGRVHGWATEGRVGTVMWIELDSKTQHCYAVGYFTPPVVLPEYPNGFSPQFHNWFAPWELAEVLRVP